MSDINNINNINDKIDKIFINLLLNSKDTKVITKFLKNNNFISLTINNTKIQEFINAQRDSKFSARSMLSEKNWDETKVLLKKYSEWAQNMLNDNYIDENTNYEIVYNEKEPTLFIIQNEKNKDNNTPKYTVFNLKKITDGYPKPLNINLDETYTLAPLWLKNYIILNSFDINKYKHKDLIEFTLSVVSSILEENLSNIVKQAIEMLVMNNGNYITLDSNPNKDAEIKNSINNALPQCIAEEEKPQYLLQLNNFWESLSNYEKKLRLICLFGHTAKKGALGYHLVDKPKNIDINQANNFFYMLAIYCAKKLQAELQAELGFYYTTICQSIDSLGEGICIEEITNTLQIECKIADLFN
jgi:hypothetical protein